MIEEKICIRYIDQKHESKTLVKSLTGIQYVEQLIFSISEDLHLGPICRYLFGLKFTTTDVWLAPNVPVRKLVKWSQSGCRDGQSKLEFRMRFRPSGFLRIPLLSTNAFNLMYTQIYHDFMRTRFNTDERRLTLLNEHTLAIVALSLTQYSIEHGIIDVNHVLNKVNPKDFVPRQAPKWQRPLLFKMADRSKLSEGIGVGLESCDSDPIKVKRRIIEEFLLKAAPDYGAEIYNVYQLLPTSNNSICLSRKQQIRVRYKQTLEDAACFVELRKTPKTKKKTTNKHQDSEDETEDKEEEAVDIGDNVWVKFVEIETITHATLNDVIVQLAEPSGHLLKFKFESNWHAESFLSCIDGYHRLMKKWNFNLCRDVHSPELRYLNELGCHGPIGYETSRAKLSEHQAPGCYLIRKCSENYHNYLIDTFLGTHAMLTIDIRWSQEKRVYIRTGHSVDWGGVVVTVTSDQEEYLNLKNLINDTKIRAEFVCLKTPDRPIAPYIFQQLKYLIHPSECDDYPGLMLSISLEKLRDRENRKKTDAQGFFNQLPRVIPYRSLVLTGQRFPTTNNGISVQLAKLNGEQEVVVKNYEEIDKHEQTRGGGTTIIISDYTFHHCPNGHTDVEMAISLRPSQMRIADWSFIKADFFAETIGYVITGTLVQEYFPLGRLDVFLREGDHIGQIVKLSASFQLAQALMFLYEKKIIHGKIRCRNVMIKQIHPISVKLTDPLGSLDVDQDQAFIPPEFFNSRQADVCIKRFDTGIDVWAFGTTMWQIFNHGAVPPSSRYANTLTQPLMCPDKVWNLIEACWIGEHNLRASPRVIYRDLFDLIAWEKGAHNYSYIRPEDQPHLVDVSQTAYSSASDLSTLNSISSSIMDSPNSSAAYNSQTDLLKSPNPTFGVAGATSNFRGSLSRNSLSNQLSSMRRPNWANLINLRRGFKHHRQSQNDDCLPPHQRLQFDDLFGSRLSLSNCSTPSGSEMTKSTIIQDVDLQSITEAFERCVWHIDSNQLKFGVEIGRGSSGVVVKGVMTRTDGEEQVVAVKCIDKESTDISERIQDLKREFAILKELNHDNIVKTLGYVDDAHMMLIFEFMPLGSLLTCVKNLAIHEKLFDLPLSKYALDIANGMEYLESKHIVHRDLALRNILLKSRNEVKICDFGLAENIATSRGDKLETQRPLPLKWYAPETLNSGVFTHKSDVWSYGVVLWEMYSGGDCPQYSGSYPLLSETLKHERLPKPFGCPPQMYQLMLKCCWQYEAEERKSFKQLRDLLGQWDDEKVAVVPASTRQPTTSPSASFALSSNQS